MISQQLPSHAYNLAGQNIPKARLFVWGMTELRVREMPNYSAGAFSRSSSRTRSAMLEVSSRFGGGGRVVLPAPALDQFENHPLLRLSLRRRLLNSQTGQSFLRVPFHAKDNLVRCQRA